ncbi:MAG: FAD-dependent oxidoreductase [Firmicutes bacterium]|nr:FAD-dependent oxidoreductase [Bacillota bacterium]MDY5855812.1 FAD-dependent oxidoreductase [Anaerovoracaceae bacterium]
MADDRNHRKPGVSLWKDTAHMEPCPRIAGVAGCDILIIGGGMAGVLLAEKLQKKGVRCIVADAFRIGQGVTGGTTAKITSQQGFLYQKLIRLQGKEQARRYLDAAEDAIREYETLASRIPCDFRRRSNVVYTLDDREKAEREMRALEQLGYPARFREKTELPFGVSGAVEFPDQASFHPLKMLFGVAGVLAEKNVSFYENTRIVHLKRWNDGGWEAVSQDGTILADQVVIASHFPFYNRQGFYYLKMHQSRTFLIAGRSHGMKLPESMYVDEEERGLTFREAEGLLLLGGYSERTGKAGSHHDCWKLLEQQAQEFYPGWKTVYQWAAQDCMTADGLPYVGPYGRKYNGLWVASGFHKWGMTGSMMAAAILAEEITGGEHPCSSMLRGGRHVPLLPVAANAGSAVQNLLRPAAPRCRHMGCALRWNLLERTWDCPCHGSRYDEKGRCLEGPSKNDLPL